MIRNLVSILWVGLLIILPFDRGPDTLGFNTFLVCSAAGFLWVYYIVSIKKTHYTIRQGSTLLAFGLFITWILLSNLWTIDAFSTYYKSLTYLSAFIIFFVTINLPKSDVSESFLINTVVVIFVIELVHGGVQFFFSETGVPIQGSAFLRSHGIFVWPNTFAGFLVLIWPLVFWIFLESKNKIKSVILYFVLITGVFVLGTTYSRGGWLAFFLSSGVVNLVIIIYSGRFRYFLNKLRWVGFGIVVVLILFSLIPNSQVGSRITSFSDLESFGRLEIWQNTLTLALEKIWTGYGFRTFHITNTQWLPPGIRFDFAHNDYLQFLLELGVIGLGLFLAFLALLSWKGWTWIISPNQSNLKFATITGMGVGALGLLFHTFVDYHLYIPGNLMIFLLFIALFLKNHPQTTTRKFPITGEHLSIPSQKFLVALTIIILIILSLVQPISKYFTSLGLHAKQLHQYDQALEYYRYASALEPRVGDNAVHIGSVYSTQALLEADHFTKWKWMNLAEKEFRHATTLGPLTWNYWQARGEFYKRHLLQFIANGFPLEKLTVLDTTMPGWEDMWLTVPKMNRFFQKALKLYPNNPDLWIDRAETWLQFEQPESSLVWFDKYIAQMPNDLSAKVAYSEALLQIGCWKQSLSTLNKVIAIDSSYGYAWYLRGQNFYHLNQLDSALLSFKYAKKINPDAQHITSWLDSILLKGIY